MKNPITAVGPLVAGVLWSLVIVTGDGPWAPHSTFLIGLGLIASSAIATAGMVVVGARWALRLGWAVIVATATLALLVDVSPWWMVGVGVSALGGIGLVGVSTKVRKLPSATGPPQRAVLLPLVLVFVPFLVGITGATPQWAALTIGVSAPLAAFLYSRVVPGGLLTVRLVWPLATLTAAPFLAWPGWLLACLIAGLVLGLAWHQSVKAAFHPPREIGSTYPIPPELTPKDILDAARIDERGRRQ